MSGDCFKVYKEVFDDDSEPNDEGEEGEVIIEIISYVGDNLFAGTMVVSIKGIFLSVVYSFILKGLIAVKYLGCVSSFCFN